jgi:hypothetical protein
VVTLAVVTVFAVLQKRKDEDMDAARRVMEIAASVVGMRQYIYFRLHYGIIYIILLI